MRIVVYHGAYGCETGCCGHYFEVDGERYDSWTFDHPGWKDDFRTWAEGLVTAEFGAEHVKDLVWDECMVTYD